MEAHTLRITNLSSLIKTFHESSTPFRISHGSTNSTRNQSLLSTTKSNIISTASLTNILSLSPSQKTILVEANVPMDRLVEATLPQNLIPAVVADFPGITVGGAFSGTTGESSSFKYGFFDRIVKRVEVILGNGEVVWAEREGEKQDMFRGAAGGLGTLGVVVALEVELVKAEKFVEVRYWFVGSFGEAVKKVREEIREEKGNDYVDGILFSRTSGVIITGRRVAGPAEGEPRLPILRFSGRKDEWFYLHVQSLLPSSSPPSPFSSSPGLLLKTELLPLPEYLFRYDRGCFWTGATLFTMSSFPLPFNSFTRWLMDPFLKTRMLYAALHAQPINIQILHDCGIPFARAEEFLEWAAGSQGIWPVWLCPLKESSRPTLHPSTRGGGEGEGMGILNVGLWGNSREGTVEGYLKQNWELEGKVREVGGAKWLYSPQWSEEEEFYAPFDRPWYDALRKKYSATTLPTIYDKARTDPGDVQRKVDALRWRDVRPYFFPGLAVHYLRKAWGSGQCREGRKSVWMEWVPREKGE